MPYIDWKKLKARVALADIIEHYGLLKDLKKSDQGYDGRCPFCGSNSLKVNLRKSTWYCFGDCKTGDEKNGGNILDFVVRMEGCLLKKAATLIDTWFPEDKSTAQKADNHPKTPEAPQERAEGGVEEGSTEPLGEAESEHTEDPEDWFSLYDRKNEPLGLELKGIDAYHQAVRDAGIDPSTAKEYGVGYFAGKGSMHSRIVFPWYDVEGRVLAYCGYSPKDGGWKYPAYDKFNPNIELWGYYQAYQQSPVNRIALCRTPLEALRYHERTAGTMPVVALTSMDFTVDQWELFRELGYHDSQKVVLVVPYGDPFMPDILYGLVKTYFVKLVQY